jgi:hypothetical protein
MKRFGDGGLDLPDFDNNTVKINNGIDRIDWPRLPLGELLATDIADLRLPPSVNVAARFKRK